MFVDSHAHLEGPKFDSDLFEVLKRARAAGVEAILCIGNGTGIASLDVATHLVSAFGRGVTEYLGGTTFITDHSAWPRLYASTGVHPHDAKLAGDGSYAEIERPISATKGIAIGEIGPHSFF